MKNIKNNTQSVKKDWYTSKFGVLAGYLPQDKKSLDNWLKKLVSDVKENSKKEDSPFHPAVQALSDLCSANYIR